MAFLERKLNIKVGKSDLLLCRRAEPRMARAIEENGIILVNENFLVKFNGVFAAVSLHNRRADNGLVLKGNWYYPRGSSVRNEIRAAFDDGETTINLPNTTWNRTREVEVYSDYISDNLPPELFSVRHLLSAARKASSELQNGQRSTTRDERVIYRTSNFEGFDLAI